MSKEFHVISFGMAKTLIYISCDFDEMQLQLKKIRLDLHELS